MSFIKLEVPPGVVRRGTAYEGGPVWYDSHLMRWKDGAMGPVPGWTARFASALTGKPRAMISWRDNTSTRWLAVGTHSKLYAASQTATAMSDITPGGFVTGSADATAAGGYGAGLYGVGAYGTPRIDTTSILEASVWTLDTFGQDLVACAAQDGVIYRWQRNIGVPAAALGGSAPTANSAIVVTPENFLFALGAGGDKRKAQWADQDSVSTWTPTASNQAGDITLATSGELRCGLRTRAQTLLSTDIDVWAATYIGLPSVYRFERVGENCGFISRRAGVAVGPRAMWMGRSGFFLYDGIVRELPCAVFEFVFNDLNLTQASKITCLAVSQSDEVWWFYPSSASTENDRYVKFNYVQGHWDFGYFSRTAGIDREIFNNPIMCDSDGYVWEHETGYTYSGAVSPYAESGPFEIGNGDRFARVREIVPDEKTQGDVVVRFYTRDAPNASETTLGPYSMDDFVSVRFAARQARMRVTGNVATGWRWGTPRLDIVEGGRR